jgi:hypothetical protein
MFEFVKLFGTSVIAILLIFGAGVLVRATGEVEPAGEAKQVENPHGPLKDTCDTCHGPEGWKPAKIAKTFDHRRFRFPLDGAHGQAACRACHLNLVFSEVGSACVSCHQDAHRGELGNDCANCHTPRSFIDRARMGRAHQQTRFPLTGAHAGADCEACHRVQANRMYVNTPIECAACHQQDYLATRNPDHNAAGFPQTCQDCHNTVAFRPATSAGDHDAAFFRIYSGRHQGKWSSCADCHVSPSNFSTFSCIQCHAHDNQASVNSDHSGVGGYTYTATSCYDCHSHV